MSLHLITGYAGKEHITSADQASFNAAIMGEGQFVMERGNQFTASIISNNKVRVLDGDLLMQGRHFRLNEDTYEELNFENGTQGYKRNDLIVGRYIRDATTGIESAELVVIKGAPNGTTASDPTYTSGDIIHGHALLNDMPLYRVPFDGLNMQTLVCLFTTVPTLETVVEEVRTQTTEAIQDMKESTVNDLSTSIATTEDNIPISTKVAKALNTLITSLTTALTGKAPNIHSSTYADYGLGTASLYGHIKLSDNYTASAGAAANAVGASSKSVADVYSFLSQLGTGFKYLRMVHGSFDGTANGNGQMYITLPYTPSMSVGGIPITPLNAHDIDASMDITAGSKTGVVTFRALGAGLSGYSGYIVYAFMCPCKD